MFTRILERHRSANGEEGMALVMVIAIGAVLTLLVTAAIAYGLGGLRKATTDESWSAAMAAAYAGIEEYQSRLANDTTYLQYGNPASPFTSASGSTVTLPSGTQTNDAFGVGASGTWADIAGSSGKAQFRYEIDNSDYTFSGTLRIRSTGLVGNETRSIVADLRQQGFIDFLYFTDYEIQDPAVSGSNVATCVKYAWAGRPSTGCSEIAFGNGDVINGPMHSNDTVRACAVTFKGPMTTSYNPVTGIKYSAKDSNNASCTGQVFELVGYPAYSPVVGMPSTNSQMKKETRSDLAADVPRPGCLFTGPTKIQFNSNGTITVRSPWTVKTRVAGDPATSGSTPADCGTTGAAGLGSAGGATFNLPANNVIYVQNVPTVATDPNYWATGALPTGLTCTGLGGSTGSGNGIGFPTTNEAAPTATSYGCRNGDLFVSGTVDGNATLAAENYVYVTGDIIYEDSNDDMLGLVGNNAVWVWNPVKADTSSVLGNTGRRVDAAILSVAHTFQVQNYDKGGLRGTLTVNGAIAQKFRGIVRGGNNGYAKNYVYDPRLKYTAPPKFLSPVSTTYGVNVWVEVKPAFAANGTAN
jgi:hypothetical protein